MADDDAVIDERTRLLEPQGPRQALEEPLLPESRSSDVDDRPLPLGQIFLLCYARIMDPIAYFSIFPFVNQMILETGDIKETDVGFYSGLIVNAYFQHKIQ